MLMDILNTMNGMAGYTAIGVSFAVAMIVHFVAPKSWSTVTWVLAFAALSAAFVGQREITASVKADAAAAATKRAEEAVAVQVAVNKARAAIADWRAKQGALISNIDNTIQGERNDAVKDYIRKSAGLRDGTVRVRYHGARCPSAPTNMLSDPGTGGVGDEAGVDLTPESGQDVLDLRAAITEDQQVIRYLRDYIKTIQDPPPKLEP